MKGDKSDKTKRRWRYIPPAHEPEESWRFKGSCRDQWEVFDVPDEDYRSVGESERQRQREFRSAQREIIQRICFDCPVFVDCWVAAWNNGTPEDGVAQAGALLYHKWRRVRREALAQSLVDFAIYQNDQGVVDDIVTERFGFDPGDGPGSLSAAG